MYECHGFAFAKNRIPTFLHEYKKLRMLLSSSQWDCQRLFKWFTIDKQSVFIASKAPSNRYITNRSDKMEELGQRNNLDVTLNKLLVDDDFGKKSFPFVANYSMLMFKPNLIIAQASHCDQPAPYSYKKVIHLTSLLLLALKSRVYSI